MPRSLRGDSRISILEAFHAKRPDLIRFFTLRLGSPAAAELLVHDILKTIVDKPPKFGSDNVATLYQIGTALLGSRSVPPDHTPAEIAGRQAQTAAALNDLAPPLRGALRLLRKGHSYAEIAREMGSSMTEIEADIATALTQLLQRLD
jgi:DNA-directed RNA polymerase specialized sigma24 family protein